MKESVTKFDLEAAFKALDELDIPTAEKGIKANKPALTEIFSRKTKFDALLEEYYDIGSSDELSDAKEAREAEVAKAKLARIEKIVDLDAESPDELLTSYVGKFIMQCPQCMTLFYKNPEDVVESEDDSNTVNVNEVCQHCGNESGYTLIGKVGEVTPEEQDELLDVQEVDVDSTEDDTEEESAEEESTEEENTEEFDLDSELAELPLDDEEEKKEESFTSHDGEALVEELKEEASLDVSADEFEALIGSPAFKKPMSDATARAMMAEFSDNENVEEALAENIKVNNETLKYAVLNSDGTYAGAPCASEEEAKELAAQQDGRIIVKLEALKKNSKLNESKELELSAIVEDSISHLVNDLGKDPEDEDFVNEVIIDIENNYETQIPEDPTKYIDWASAITCEVSRQLNKPLTEGIFDKLKDKFTDTIDKIAGKLKSREAKADWVLANAREDYNNVKADTKGQLVPDEKNQRFHTFVVIGYTDKYSDGETITMAPSFNNKDLVIGKNGIQVKKSYKDADNIAKGWSMTQGNGPAFIYLAKAKDDPDAVFLCEYFQGELENDQLEKYFGVVKNHLKGAKLMAKGGMTQADEGADTDTEIIKGADLKVGMTLIMTLSTKAGKVPGKFKITKIDDSGDPRSLHVTVNSEDPKDQKLDGSIVSIRVTEDCTIVKEPKEFSATTESLNSIMNNFEELQEASLESYISDSLVDAYGNVAGFRLKGCSYLEEKFTIDGTIHFTSGKTRDTLYVFTEALDSGKGQIELKGFNEKLGLDKQFTIIGYADKTGKTFITESFNCTKHN